MEKTAKIILTLILSIMLLCFCASAALLTTGIFSLNRFVSWTDKNITEDPGEAVRIGSEIADFEVPSGYGSPYGIHFGDVMLIGYKTPSERSILFMAQFPQGTRINVDEMLRLIREGSGDPNSIWYNTETILIEQKVIRIRGQETNLNISEGISSEGITYRAATATFQGRGGPTLVMMAGPVDEWNIDDVEAFIDSIQ